MPSCRTLQYGWILLAGWLLLVPAEGTPLDEAALEVRKLTALQDRLANPWPDPATSGDGKAAYCLAAYSLDEGTEQADSYVLSLPTDAEDFYFAMVEFVRILADPDLNARMSAAARTKLETVFWDWIEPRSLVERAGKVWEIDGSENHNAVRNSVYYLTAQALSEVPDYAGQQLADGYTVEEHADAWRDYWKLYFPERARKGLEVEVHSPTYTKYTLSCYYNLHDLTVDPVLRTRSKSYLDLYFAEKAQVFLPTAGFAGGSQSRIYKDQFTLRPNYSSSYFLGWHDQGGGTHPANIPPMVTDYRCPELIAAMARGSKSSYEASHAGWGLEDLVVARPWPPITYYVGFEADGSSGALMHCSVTDAYVMGTTSLRPDRDFNALAGQNRAMGVHFNSRSVASGSDRILVQGIGTAQGRETGYAEINGMGGSNCQVIWRDQRNNQSTGTRVYLSEGDVLDNEVAVGDWWFSETAGAYVGIRVANPGWVRSSIPAGAIQTLQDSWSPVIIECARKPDYASFAAFQAAMADNAFAWEGRVLTYTSEAGDVFEVAANSDAFPKKNGSDFDYAPPQNYNSPYLNGLTADGKITVSYAGYEPLVLDFGPGGAVIEAESSAGQAAFAPFVTEFEPGALGAIVVPNGTGDANGGSDVTEPDGRASYPFNLSQDNDLVIEARVSFANGNDDSFWYRVDGGAWTLTNAHGGGGWKWIDLGVHEGLSAGEHVLEIARREDGARIDQFRLTTQSGAITLPRRLKVVGSDENRIAGNNQASNTISGFVVEEGEDRKLVLAATYEGGGSGITGITYAGAEFTEVRATSSNPSSIWFLDNPAVGTGDVVLSFDGTTSKGSHIGVLSLQDAAPGVFFDVGVLANTSSYTTTVDHLFVAEAYAANSGAVPVVPDALATLFLGSGYSGHGAAGFRMIHGAGPVTHDWGTETNRPTVTSAGFLTAVQAVAGDDQAVVDEDFSGSESVILDGSASRPGSGVIASYSWSKDGTELATGANPTVELSVGEHSLLLTVTDSAGVTDAATVTVTVSEVAPEILVVNLAENQDADSGTNTNTIPGFEVTAESHRKLVVSINSETSGTITSITYGGESLQPAVVSGSSGRVAQIWYLDDPAVGTADIVATYSVNRQSRMGALSLANAAAGGPVVSNSVPNGANSIDLTTTETDVLVVGSYIQNGTGGTVADPFLSPLYHGDCGSSWGIAGFQNEVAAGLKNYTWFNSDGGAGIAVAGFAPFVNPDSDYDGMPDAWEMEQFGTLAKEPGDDEDGDGGSNSEEYVAGTDPEDAGSFFAIESIAPAPAAGFVLQWQSVPGRNYVVYHSEFLEGNWLPISEVLAGTGGLLSFTDPEDEIDKRFYRIVVTLP